MDRKGDWLQTFTGRAYWPLDPRVEDINIEDVAHGLSNMCRFGGQCRNFYSVAEHSVHVSRWMENYYQAPKLLLYALLHDASEAYLVDVPRPIKVHLENYKTLEALNMSVILKAFRIEPSLCPDGFESTLHLVDNQVLVAEKNALLLPPPLPWTWAKQIMPADVEISCYGPDSAKSMFLSRFSELTQHLI
jgi:hypothetical protein